MKRCSRCLIYLLIGILIGIGFCYLKSLCTFNQKVVYKDDIGNIVIETQENMGFRILTISKKNKPLLKLQINKIKRNIESAAVYDENKRVFELLYFSEGRIDFLELLTKDKIQFFQMEYDSEMQRWCHATYCKKTSPEKIIGDFNEDINVDGHFDTTQILDNDGSYLGSLVYFNKRWNPVINLSENGLEATVATDSESKETVELEYDFEEGWIPAK